MLTISDNLKTRSCAFLLAGMLLALAAQSDVLEMEDGTVVAGTYVDATADYILFEVDGDVTPYAVGDVRSMGLSEEAPPEGWAEPIVVPKDTKLIIRMTEGVDSKRHKAGHMFSGRLEGDLAVGGVVVARNGSKVYGRLTDAKKAGRVAGKAVLALELTDLTVDEKPHPITTSEYRDVTAGEEKRTAKRLAKGAAIGGIIDGSDGAKRGLAIRGGISLITPGEQIKVPAGTLLEFTLAEDLVIQE
jgi:hypothetical protein